MKKQTDRVTFEGLISEAIRDDGEYTQLLTALKTVNRKQLPFMVTGLCEGASDALCLSICEDMPGAGPVFLVCPDERECLRLQKAFETCGLRAGVFPGRDFNFHNIVSSREFEQSRLGILASIIGNEIDVVLSTPDAACGYTMPRDVLKASLFTIDSEFSFGPDKLCGMLVKSGYSRADMAEGAGQFAKRGGIIDICLPDRASEHGVRAVRVEFFGDDIDRICTYDPDTQRVIENIRGFTVSPAHEVIPDTAALNEIKASVSSLLKKAEDPLVRSSLESELGSVRSAVDSGSELLFADKYISLIYPQKESLFDYIPDSSLRIIKGNSAVNDRIKASEWQWAEEIKSMVADGLIAGKYAEYGKEAKDFPLFVSKGKTVLIDAFVRGVADSKLGGLFGFRTKHSVCYADNTEMLKEEIQTFVNGKYRILLMAQNETQAKNYEGLISDWGIPARAAESPDGSDIPFSLINVGTVTILPSIILQPFELLSPRVAILSLSHEGYSASQTRKKPVKKKNSNSESILSYADLRIGDYVVHENHGIGIFMGISTITVGESTSDYITIQYAGTDKLFMPVDKLDKVSKYIGAHSDDGSLKLSKFGGAEWGKTKARAKAALKDIAKDLINLYAERMRKPGFKFPADDEFQKDFEAAFEYDETDAQIEAADEIKKDMTKPVPMDRLLCGDVGYGKTEVAFRAIYKAILGGKQVALMVPTTILAMQHYQTAQSRMRQFPVNIGILSRFVSPKVQKKTIEGVERGDIDLLIGTHRLLSKDINFKNLGLLVVDEEQRFGVAQKEKIKQRAGNIDVLSLSATPIPRTLNMAMTGIRDISLLDEAPGDRLPVQTYVLEHDDIVIIEAVRRELRRGGQVFYLFNNVENIDIPAAKLKAAIPEARIQIAHGKMEKDRIEEIWRDMTAGEIDVLVCTTIIETGVDVPNANTLIVENAHKMGLSQLHQLRGRVGRSPRRAFAYFTFPRGRALTEIAQKRLEAIRDYAEFGAGFRIAMRDLEIRGAGSVLGAEQHGHLDSVGYDMYIKLLGEAVLEEKGEAPKKETECTVSLSKDAYLPSEYIESAVQRMSMYKRIAHIKTKSDMDDIYDELLDRYGELPAGAEALLSISYIRAMAADCGITSITQSLNDIRITSPDIDFPIWQKLADKDGYKIRAVLSNEPFITLSLRHKDDPIRTLTSLFADYGKIASEIAVSDVNPQ